MGIDNIVIILIKIFLNMAYDDILSDNTLPMLSIMIDADGTTGFLGVMGFGLTTGDTATGGAGLVNGFTGFLTAFLVDILSPCTSSQIGFD